VIFLCPFSLKATPHNARLTALHFIHPTKKAASTDCFF